MPETRTPEWYETQLAQYRSELDALNPRLNVAEARLSELEAKLSLGANEKEALTAKLAQREAAYTAYCQEADAQLAELKAALGKAGEDQQFVARVLANVQEERTAAVALVHQLRTALDQKNAALAPCLRGVAAQLELLQQAVAAGND